MFDVGLPEILVLLLVAVFVFGPDRLPDVARQAGKFVRTARQLVNNARRDLSAELGTDVAGLDPRELVRKHVLDVVDEDDTPRRPGHRPLAEGERPPYDYEAT
ncbi:MAG TPA: sec-independent translocase [Nocardioidaceae bacterium]|nr:sec-independent translocase [Nocardioidaceae bacterium]